MVNPVSQDPVGMAIEGQVNVTGWVAPRAVAPSPPLVAAPQRIYDALAAGTNNNISAVIPVNTTKHFFMF
jgi:hypothetical protein